MPYNIDQINSLIEACTRLKYRPDLDRDRRGALLIAGPFVIVPLKAYFDMRRELKKI